MLLPPETFYPLHINLIRHGRQTCQALRPRCELCALQDHQRATLVGETTFGTGTVLNEFGLSDGSAILLATEQWLTPDGRVIWRQGIVPDETVEFTGTALLVPETANDLTAEQVAASGDAQVLRAVELLSTPQ